MQKKLKGTRYFVAYLYHIFVYALAGLALLLLTTKSNQNSLSLIYCLQDIKIKMLADMTDRNPNSINLTLGYGYDDTIVSFKDMVLIDNILYALPNASEIITEVNDEGDVDGQ